MGCGASANAYRPGPEVKLQVGDIVESLKKFTGGDGSCLSQVGDRGKLTTFVTDSNGVGIVHVKWDLSGETTWSPTVAWFQDFKFISQQEKSEREGIALAQQTSISAGVVTHAGKSIRLDPICAEGLRQKVRDRAQVEGGRDKLFKMCDSNHSKTIELSEFKKLLMALNDEEEGAPITMLDIHGEEQTLQPSEASALLTEREATALFWHLDEDASDHIELDEFEAWLRTGEYCTQHRSYRKKKE